MQSQNPYIFMILTISASKFIEIESHLNGNGSVENKVHMVTEPFGCKQFINQHGNEKWNGFPIHTSIGHVHLHVSNLVKAKNSIISHWDFTILHHIPVHISLRQMDITIILPLILGLELTSYQAVLMIIVTRDSNTTR